MLLTLVRHARAEKRDPGRWPCDAERPLSLRGERRFRRASRGIARLGSPPARLLTSPARRAWSTSELLTEEAGWPAPVACPELAPGRPATEALRVLGALAARAEPLGGVVAAVGHEPALSRLASLLLVRSSGGALRQRWRTGGVLLLHWPDPWASASATLLAALPPRVLRSLAP